MARRRVEWLTMWHHEGDRGSYPRGQVRREVAQLEAELFDVLARLRGLNPGSLHDLATRIQARAVRRAGDLLKQFNDGPGRPKTNGAGSGTISQRNAADRAGMSKRQEVTAVRVSNVPEDEFEEAIEREDPPTVTALAARGTNHQEAR